MCVFSRGIYGKDTWNEWWQDGNLASEVKRTDSRVLLYRL